MVSGAVLPFAPSSLCLLEYFPWGENTPAAQWVLERVCFFSPFICHCQMI